MKLIFTFVLIFSLQFCLAQSASEVTTIATGLGSVRGLDFDSQGNIFVASGSILYKVAPNGDKAIFTTESGFIWEVKIDSADNIFYATNTQITKLDQQKNKTVIANTSGYWYQGVAFDGNGNIFTSSNLANSKPHILTPNGNGYTEAAWGGTIQLAEYGIAYDKNSGWLYVANVSPGGLYKTNAAGTVMIISINGKAMDCEVDPLGNVFVTTLQDQVIKKVDMLGNVTVFAGTGIAGNVDGPLNTAQFANPSYICYHNGDLYVTDNSSNTIRKISNVITGIENNPGQLFPKEFSLSQNYPNPFNPSTQIRYSLASAGNVSLKVFDVLGNKVATLVSGELQAGEHSTMFDASTVSSGIYFYTLRANGFTESKKMLLIK